MCQNYAPASSLLTFGAFWSNPLVFLAPRVENEHASKVWLHFKECRQLSRLGRVHLTTGCFEVLNDWRMHPFWSAVILSEWVNQTVWKSLASWSHINYHSAIHMVLWERSTSSIHVHQWVKRLKMNAIDVFVPIHCWKLNAPCGHLMALALIGNMQLFTQFRCVQSMCGISKFMLINLSVCSPSLNLHPQKRNAFSKETQSTLKDSELYSLQQPIVK